MATRKLILGSAACLLLLSAPVLAQSGDPAQTYSAARAQYDSELRIYNQEQRDYERERSEYNAKIDEYQRSLDAPLPRRMPDAVVADPDYDAVVVADPDTDVVVLDDFSDRLIIRNVPPLMRLEDVADVNDRLFNMPVLDAAGLPVGHFRRIETKDPGDLVAVITLDGSRRTISMLTEHVRFDPDSGRIIADMTAREIDRIPSGFPYG